MPPAASEAPPTHTPRAPLAIALQPLGTIPPQAVEAARVGITRRFAAKVVVLPAEPLPRAALNVARGRYRADRLLDHLDRRAAAREFEKIVGVTSHDISTTLGKYSDWGVFGLGDLGGRACVASTFRLGQGRVPEERFRRRWINVVAHEVGHTLGLDHCSRTDCLMQDACGSIRGMDREAMALCDPCRKRLPGGTPAEEAA